MATKSGKLIVFTPEFDVHYEAPIDDGDLTFHNVPQGQDKDETISDA